MKKLLLIIMAVIGFAGMSVAQDVYSSGYYTDANGNQKFVYEVLANGVIVISYENV